MFVCSATYRERKALYLVDGQGTVLEELARPVEGEWFGHFAVSPDARWVAYTCHVPRRQDRDAYPIVRAVPAAGGEGHELEAWDPRYETCYQNPVFSPTGEKMICEFGLKNAYNPDLQVLRLYDFGDRLSSSTTGLSIVNPMHIGNHAPQFMEDGERVVYFGNFDYADMLEVCLYDPKLADHDLLGELGWRLTENADGVWRRPRAIAVQPEWEQIFFVQGHNRDKERICVILLSDLPPGGHRKIFDTVGGEHGRIGGLEMARNGLRLAYDADGSIYMVGSDGSGLRRISPDGVTCRCPRFAQDGTRIAYVGNDKLYLADVEGGTPLALTGNDFHLDTFVWA
jgi:hypothetical protein